MLDWLSFCFARFWQGMLLERVAVKTKKHYPHKHREMIESFTLIHLTLGKKSNNEQSSFP